MSRMKLKILLLAMQLTASFGIDYDDFCKVDKRSIVCLRKDARCGIDNVKCAGDVRTWKMTDVDRQISLDKHNHYRELLASGKDPKGPGKVSNMNVFAYSMELEYSAQCLANGCDYKNKPGLSPKFNSVGQNVYKYSGDGQFHISYALESWYEEINHMPPGGTTFIQQAKDIGNYTQMVWAKSNLVGCGKNIYSKEEDIIEVLFVCHYAPGGNFENGQIVQLGKPCSACGNKEPCNDRYPSLCGNTLPFPMDTDFRAPEFEFIARTGGSLSPTLNYITFVVFTYCNLLILSI